MFKKILIWLKNLFLSLFNRKKCKLEAEIIWKSYGPVVKITYDFNGVNRKEPLLLWIHESGNFNNFINLAFIEDQKGEQEFDIVFDDFPEGKNCEVTLSTIDIEKAQDAPSVEFTTPGLPLAIK